MLPLPLHIWFEAGALLFGLLCWRKIRYQPFQLFVPFLAFIVIVELTGRYLNRVMHEENAWLYNLSIPVEFLFYAILFRYAFHAPRLKRFTTFAIVAFLLFCLINIIFIQGFREFNTNILKTGNFFMIVLSGLYFWQLMEEEKRVYLLREPMFWVATGVFLFNAGEFFYSLFSDYLIRNHLDKTKLIFSSINNKLILVLYTCIAISFLCTEPKPQKH